MLTVILACTSLWQVWKEPEPVAVQIYMRIMESREPSCYAFMYSPEGYLISATKEAEILDIAK